MWTGSVSLKSVRQIPLLKTLPNLSLLSSPLRSWETSSALHLSITQGLSVDLLVLHPPQEQEAHSIAHAAKARGGARCRCLCPLT